MPKIATAMRQTKNEEDAENGFESHCLGTA